MTIGRYQRTNRPIPIIGASLHVTDNYRQQCWQNTEEQRSKDGRYTDQWENKCSHTAIDTLQYLDTTDSQTLKQLISSLSLTAVQKLVFSVHPTLFLKEVLYVCLSVWHTRNVRKAILLWVVFSTVAIFWCNVTHFWPNTVAILAALKSKLKTYLFSRSQWLMMATRRSWGVFFVISAPRYKWLYLLTYLHTLYIKWSHQ